MKIKPTGPPKITISYEGIEVSDSEGCLVVAIELVCIVLFLMLIHAI